MATLVEDKSRDMELGDFNDLPMVASDTIFEGAAVGSNSGLARPLQAGDPFMGFADYKVENELGAAGAERVRVLERGKIVLSVAGVTGNGDLGDEVYASDDDTFTLTVGSNSLIGKIVRYVSGTTVVVSFKAAHLAD